MKKLAQLLSLSATVGLLAACSTTPKVIQAQQKHVDLDGKQYVLGGSYYPDSDKLVLTVNGDPVMRGSFPPFTPTLNLGGRYAQQKVDSSCYFGSILGNEGGVLGIVASAVQSTKSSNGDKCEIKLAGKVVETLYF
ncbi:hypothetical protein [Vibrio proteolyticus]|uniref:Lipoprotein n=1 Tax=Vibrio proteolyticus NBRC 13287 TaxID=1219065 RepID=U3A715_VIBPR|nr:hypothetical protein [Vibrio proteolyticus]GAD69485.1 hypothetical protein VPR01S_31_00160 [Vibrio proteolyticus NBRC 13287]